MLRMFKYVALLLAVLLVVAGCAAPAAAPAAPAGDTAASADSGSAAAADLLSEVQARGKLIVSTRTEEIDEDDPITDRYLRDLALINETIHTAP